MTKQNITRLLELCIEITNTKKAEAFFWFYGHVRDIDFEVHIPSFFDDKQGAYRGVISMDCEDGSTKHKEVLDKLSGILNELKEEDA